MVDFFLLFFRIIQPHTIGNVIIHQCLNDIIRCKDQPGNIIIITIVQIFLCSGNHSVRYSSPEPVSYTHLKTQDAAVNIPQGFEGGALDFASSPFSWAIFHMTYTFKIIGSAILVLITLFLMVLNRRAIIKYQQSVKNAQ